MIPFIDLVAENEPYIDEIEGAVHEVVRSGSYILGSQVDRFEEGVKEVTGSKYCVGVANGTDGLVLALRCIGVGEGDEVITVANSYLATVSSIILAGATPVLCDVESDTGLMSIESLERSVTEKTKAIIVVHLGGYAANLDEIIRFCSENGIKLIEDCAQAFGTVDENDVHVGNRSSIGVFSAHPLKNLAALGDAGFVITNSDEYDHWLRKARSHGSINRDDIEFPSINSRLDEIQAAVLNVKLKYFSELIAERRKKVLRYRKGISAVVSIPAIDSIQRASHHLLIVRVTRREEVIGEVIKRCGIELKVHYPVPYHRFTFQGGVKIYDSLENTDNRAASIVSLPLGRHISNDVIDGICGVITDYEGR